jgi:hypothetical protein
MPDENTFFTRDKYKKTNFQAQDQPKVCLKTQLP